MIARSRIAPSRLTRDRLVGSPASRRRAALAVARYELGDPGHPSPVPTLLIAVFDNSGSVISPAGTDPLSNRFAEVAEAFRVVAKRSARHERGAVLHLDTPTSGDVGPVPITKRGLLTLRAGLHVPPDGAGSSELAPSLARATEMAEAHPEHTTTLVVLSDFLLLDPDPRPVLSDLAAFAGDVHAVVLGTPLPAGVLDESITVTYVDRDDPPGAVARALFASLTTYRPGSRSHSATTDPGPRRRLSPIPQHISHARRDETGGVS